MPCHFVSRNPPFTSNVPLWCVLSLLLAWTSYWTNSWVAGDLRRHDFHGNFLYHPRLSSYSQEYSRRVRWLSSIAVLKRGCVSALAKHDHFGRSLDFMSFSHRSETIRSTEGTKRGDLFLAWPLELMNCVLCPLYLHGLTLIPAWIRNHMPSKMWDEITYPFPNFNGSTVEVCEWISYFIPHIIMGVITYPCRLFKLNHVSKRATGDAYMRRGTGPSSLILEMACRLIGVKPLPEPTLADLVTTGPSKNRFAWNMNE